MELDLSTDQELLRETAARFIADACPLSTVRQMIGAETDLPEDYLETAGRLGWFSMLVPENLGGGSVSGAGLCDVAIIAEERGRTLQPGPLTGMNIAAATLAAAGSIAHRTEIVPAVRDGRAIATWVPGAGAHVVGGRDQIVATPRAEGVGVSGRVQPVQGGAQADWLLVTAGSPPTSNQGLSQFVVHTATPGVTVTPLAGLDVTQRYAAISFEDVVVPDTAAVGEFGGADPDVERQLQLACVLTTAETVGAMDALFDITRSYAIDRTAFGRPIGSFQAVKHQLADMSLALEASKAIAAAAVRAVQETQVDASQIVSMAKSWVADAGVDLAQGCAQVFAGIGFTWEHDLHLYLRRITMNGLLFGQSDWHRERICRLSVA
jgi:alkylation response protein AidB-like acyl-CoA dehydrogenase